MAVPSACERFVQGPFLFYEVGYLFFTYYIFIPIVLLFGIAGNVVCLRIIRKKFIKEHGFQYQIVIIVADIGAILTSTVSFAILQWGLQTRLIPLNCVHYTHFWLEETWWLVELGEISFALCQVFNGLGSYLLLGSAVDRCAAILVPLFYKFRMKKRLFLACVALFAVLANVWPGLRILLAKELTEVPVLDPDLNQTIVTYKKIWLSGGFWMGPVVSSLISASKIVGFVALFIANITLGLAYRHKVPSAEERGFVNKKTLFRLLLVQCLLVLIGILPHAVVNVYFAIYHVTPFGDPYNFFVISLTMRDIGTSIQISFNVIAYSCVSPRFRREVFHLFKKSNQVQAIPAANHPKP